LRRADRRRVCLSAGEGCVAWLVVPAAISCIAVTFHPGAPMAGLRSTVETSSAAISAARELSPPP
jgi:hypothetical protein